jgi:hypothetical protein
MCNRVRADWYISGDHARRAIGYLSGAMPELSNVDVPRLAAIWDEALMVTGDDLEASPVHAHIVEKGLQW